MKNRIVGISVVIIAILFGFIVNSFNNSLKDIVVASCSEGVACPMIGTIDYQTTVSIVLIVIMSLIGMYLIFFSKEERIVTNVVEVKEQLQPKTITKENYKEVINKLGNDEKVVFEEVIEAQGSAMQSDIVKKTGLTKVKVTRLLDKLEGRGLIERKRRGMSNIIILKK